MTNFFSLSRPWPDTRWLARPLAALALGLATAGAAQAQTAPAFAPVALYNMGGNPVGPQLVDVNGDGFKDLLTANYNNSTLGVRLGTGTGTLGTLASTPTGAQPLGLAVADLNGDGKLDAVTANFSSNQVGVLLGNGTGGFGAVTQFPSGSGPFQVALGDFNGDGKLDAVTANYTSGKVGVLLGTGTGTFGAVTEYSAGGTPNAVAVGDMSGDGRLDVVVTLYTGSVSVLLGTGTGSLGTATLYPLGTGASRGVALGDLNRDGRLDIVAAGNSATSVAVLLNTGAGAFGTASTYAGGTGGTIGVAVGDVNGDGFLDVAAARNGRNAVEVWPGTGTGTLGTAVSLTTDSTTPQDVALGDLNNDGKPDLVAGEGNSAGTLLNAKVFLNTTVLAPTLSSLSPTSGPVGTGVTLTGTNLGSTTSVSFNGTAATTFAVVNATTVTATVPTGASSGLVTVTTPGGPSNGLAFVVGTPTNNALAFDGTSDYVTAPHRSAYSFTSAITVEAWVRTSVAGEQYITTKSEDSWYLAMNGGGGPTGVASFFLNGPSSFSGGWLYGTTNLADNRWHHVAGTYDGATLRLYVDGVLQNSRTAIGALQTNISPINIGARDNSSFWNGSIDEVRVYSTALTLAQVQADMFSANGAAAVPASLRYYANFDQGIAGDNNAGLTSLPDLSSTNNTGTLHTFALTGTTSNWVRSFPTITGISPSTGGVGTAVTVTGTNLLDATGFAFNGTAVAPFTAPTADLTATVAVPSGAVTGPVSLASAALARYNGPVFTVTVTATTWTGNTSTDWFTASNWTDGLPTSTLDAIIPTSPSGGRFPLITANATPANARNLSIASGAFLTMTDNTLILAANLTNNGSFTGFSGSNGGTLVLGNTALGLLNGGGVNRFWNLTVGPNGAQLNNSNVTSVRRVLALNGNFTTTGNPFTLLSDAAGTAMVVNNGGAVVNGNATMQRYIDPSLNGGLGYRHYSSPVQSATVNSLATSGFTPVVNPDYNTQGNTVSTFPTVFGYDESRISAASATTQAFEQGYFSPAALSSPLTVGRGYTVNISATEKVSLTGPLNNGPVNVGQLTRGTEANSGWQLLGNPYPAPLDWNAARGSLPAGVLDAIYVYKSSDQYDGTYQTYVNGFGTLPGGLVPSMQGFFLRVSQTVPAFSFLNSWRTTSYQNPAFNRGAADLRPAVQLDLVSAQGTHEPTFIYFEQGATAGFDAHYDAEKLPNTTGLNLSSEAAGRRLAVSGLPLGPAGTVVPLAVGVPTTGTYTLTAARLLNLGSTDVYLHDTVTGQQISLKQQPGYTFTAANAALITGRFSLHFGTLAPTASQSGLLAASVRLYPNPAHRQVTVDVPAVAGAAQAALTLYNVLGQPVRTTRVGLPAAGAQTTVDLLGLPQGVYVLRIQAGPATVTKSVVVE